MQEKLDTTLHSDSRSSYSGNESGHSRQLSEEEGGGGCGLDPEDSIVRPDEDMVGEEEVDGMTSRSIGAGHRGVISPETGLHLNVIQEASDGEQEEVKYFPPKKGSA